jgi:hypothetical protein
LAPIDKHSSSTAFSRGFLLNVEQRVQTSIFNVTGATNLLKVKEEMANLPGGIGSHTVLPHTETWGKLLSLGSAPYNHHGMHWSERELHEPIYNDDVVSAAAKKDQTPNSTGKVGCLPDVSSNPSSRPRRRTGGISREASYQIATLDAEYDAISRQLELVLRSTSWKISAPIRMVVRRVPMLARLSRTILGPFWRWMYIVLRRREPVVTRRSAGLKAPPLDAMARFKRLQSRPGRDVVLVAADAPPMFDKQSGGLRLYNLIRIFCEMDCRVVFVSQCGQDYFTGIAGSAEQQKRYEGLLYAAGVERVVYGPEEAEYLIRELGSELSWAFLSFPNVADQFIQESELMLPGPLSCTIWWISTACGRAVRLICVQTQLCKRKRNACGKSNLQMQKPPM